MTIETLVRDVALADATVASLVADRMTPLVLEQGAGVPAIRYQVVTAQRQQSLSQPSNLKNTRIQFDCYAKTYEAALAVCEALRLAIEASDQYECIQGMEQDLPDDDPKLYRRTTEFSFWRNDPAGSPA